MAPAICFGLCDCLHSPESIAVVTVMDVADDRDWTQKIEREREEKYIFNCLDC